MVNCVVGGKVYGAVPNYLFSTVRINAVAVSYFVCVIAMDTQLISSIKKNRYWLNRIISKQTIRLLL